jgi:hypothetical protein
MIKEQKILDYWKVLVDDDDGEKKISSACLIVVDSQEKSPSKSNSPERLVTGGELIDETGFEFG